MPKVTKRFTFDAAHRLLYHDGKCKNLHGHTYVAEVTVEGPTCDPNGMVIDFGDLKCRVGEWIDRFWDHATILNRNDPLLKVLDEIKSKFCVLDYEPTAEYMAKILYGVSLDAVAGIPAVQVTCVRIYETPTSWADYTPEDIARGR